MASAAAAVPARARRGRTAEPSSWYLAPALVFFGAFAIVPLLVAVGLSFTTWDGLTPPRFTGLDNWVDEASATRSRTTPCG